MTRFAAVVPHVIRIAYARHHRMMRAHFLSTHRVAVRIAHEHATRAGAPKHQGKRDNGARDLRQFGVKIHWPQRF